MSQTEDYELYDLGDFKLKLGVTLPKAQIAYKTFGSPDKPAIIYPTWYSGGQSPMLHKITSTNHLSQPSPTTHG
jgi:homoserine acetyltransferase